MLGIGGASPVTRELHMTCQLTEEINLEVHPPAQGAGPPKAPSPV
jgi:hypothetical protein